MNRQRDQYTPTTHPNKYYSTATNNYPDYGYPPEESRKQQDSDLVIFNGAQQERNVYQMQTQKQQMVTQQTNISRSSSQKAFPIIYNTYNENRTQIDHSIPNSRIPVSTREMPQTFRPTNEQIFEPSHSDVYQYGESNTKKQEQNMERHEFHTFNYIPSDSKPQTAHFLQIPSNNSEGYSQHKQQLQPKKAPFYYQQHQQINSLPIHVLPKHEERNLIVSQHSQQMVRPGSRIFGNNMTVASPRMVERVQQVQQTVIPINQQRPNYIQISHDEYQRYQDHMSMCRTNQQELNSLRLKNQELSSKQRFYWEENATLRQQNTRLRDLVTHFQKREKELLRERQQLRTSLSQNIHKYQQSTLQQVGLLLQRYRLQLQKKK